MTKAQPSYKNRTSAGLPIGQQVPKWLGGVTKKRGFGAGELVLAWGQLCPEYIAYCCPLKLYNGMLTLAVNSSSAKQQLQFWLPTLQSRIDTHFGMGLVQDIRLVVQDFEAVAIQMVQPLAKQSTAVEENIDLTDALARLGGVVRG